MAYSAYTDFEAASKWSKRKREVRIARKEGGSVYLEETSGGGGQSAARKMELFPPARVESEGETRFTRTRSTVTFEETADGTKVTASLDVRIKGRWGLLMRTQGKAEAESSAMEELAAFANYVEALAGAPSKTEGPTAGESPR